MSGKFMYDNHYQMKKNRLKVLDNLGNFCQNCGGDANVVHHIDGTKDNHDTSNLMPLCYSCHMALHKVNRQPVVWDVGMIEVAMAQRGMDKGMLAQAIDASSACITSLIKKGQTKNSTMRKIADALGYPLTAFLSPESKRRLEELARRGGEEYPCTK